MMVPVAMFLLSSMMTSKSFAEGANMIRQRNTRRVVEASSPVVAKAAAAVHTHQEQQTAMEFGVVNTVDEEEELDQYFRHLVPSSMSSMPDAPTPSPTDQLTIKSYSVQYIDSPFTNDRKPTACDGWKNRCLIGASKVAAAAENNVEFIQAGYFSTEACEGAFSCDNPGNSSQFPNFFPGAAWEAPSIAYEPDDKSTAEAQYLVLHMPGTSSPTVNQTDYTNTVADEGFYVLSLVYSSYPFAVDNSDAYCMSSPETSSDCNTNLHECVVLGCSTNPLWPVPPDESIQSLATKNLQSLGWNQFLSSKGDNDSMIDWSKVIVTGHSQGGSHAAYMSTQLPVARAVLLSGPQEVVNATWMHSSAYDVVRRAMFSEHEWCSPDPYEYNYCGAYKVGTNLTNGILYRNLGYMNMTQDITIIDDMIGNNAFFIQDYTPLYCPKNVPPNNGNGCYHNSNVFNYDAPPGVKKTWPDLYKNFV
jgi:hypothetical protein